MRFKEKCDVGEDTINAEPNRSCKFTHRGYSEISRVACLSILILAAFLYAPRIGWADQSYFQIISDSIPLVEQEGFCSSWKPFTGCFIQDRGYAVYVSYEGNTFLMDTGISEATLESNLEAAGISLEDLDFVLLTHRHIDHISGLSYIRSERPSLPIYVPPGGGYFVWPEEFIEINDYVKISTNIFLMHTHDENDSMGITDEVTLLIVTGKGPFMFTSNSHHDIFMKLEKAKHLAGQDVVFHSGGTARRITSKDTIRTNANKMKARNVRQVSPSHSNPSHDKIFEEIFGVNYIAARLGKKVPLEPVSE